MISAKLVLRQFVSSCIPAPNPSLQVKKTHQDCPQLHIEETQDYNFYVGFNKLAILTLEKFWMVWKYAWVWLWQTLRVVGYVHAFNLLIKGLVKVNV